MAKQQRKHVPQRSCIACRQKFDKRRLTRLVRTVDTGVVVDTTGKQAGRGAYLCDRPDCWKKALSSNLIERALRAKLSPAERERLADFREANFSDENEDNV